MCIPVYLFFRQERKTPVITDILMRDPFYTGTCEKKTAPLKILQQSDIR